MSTANNDDSPEPKDDPPPKRPTGDAPGAALAAQGADGAVEHNPDNTTATDATAPPHSAPKSGSKSASPDSGSKPSSRAEKPAPSGLGCFFTMGGIFFGLLLGSLGSWMFCGDPEETPPESVDELRESPNIVVAIRDLARLETTSYHVERVIDLVARQRQLFGLVEAEDAILLVAAGEVDAGVDLTRMSDGDVVIEPEAGRATITLPEPEVFSARLDNERTYVHTRDTDLAARRDPHLETRARREAEATLRDAALEAGIIERARANAETSVGTLVRSLGYDQVTIQWREAQPNPEQ